MFMISLLTQQYVCVMCTLWSDNTCVFTRFHSVKNKYTAYLELCMLFLLFCSSCHWLYILLTFLAIDKEHN
jgi:hypothetical protein